MNDSSSLVGSQLAGRYRLDAVIGRGGTATVYRATDESLGRIVAIKVIDLAAADDATVARQRAEVQMIASFSHPTLVTLFDAEIDRAGGGERAYLVMQFIDGSTLPRGPLPVETVAAILADIADALAYVHERGVIHRDVKPGNILVPFAERPGAPRAHLADFGIARFVDGLSLTAAGTVIGTASYLSPEQALGGELTAASDIYSLGLVGLESVTGTAAFPGHGMESVAARLATDPVIPDAIPDTFAALLSAMTERDPRARPDAEEVEARMRAIASGTATPSATVSMAAVVEDPTAPMGAMPGPGMKPTDAETVVLDTAAATGSATGDRQARRGSRVAIGIAGALVAVAAITFGAIAATSNSSLVGSTPSPTATRDRTSATPTPDVASPAVVATSSATPSVTVPSPAKAAKPGKTAKPGKGHGRGHDKP